jgi:Zn-dependent peptidase ImmA (M78 family)
MRSDADRRSGLLGRITFSPPAIVIFADPMERHRSRFTLAHELGHLLLGHGAYLHAESVDDNDLEQCQVTYLDDDDIRRLEWQANSFASCLLLPSNAFVRMTFNVAAQFGLKDKGFGLIYLDQQPVNRRSYYALTSALMDAFAVSRTAVTIRLKTLGLLIEADK